MIKNIYPNKKIKHNIHQRNWSKFDQTEFILDFLDTLREEILAGRKFGGFGGFCPKPPN